MLTETYSADCNIILSLNYFYNIHMQMPFLTQQLLVHIISTEQCYNILDPKSAPLFNEHLSIKYLFYDQAQYYILYIH